MIGPNQIVQNHRKQRALTPALASDVSHKKKCPRFREGIFSNQLGQFKSFVTVSLRERLRASVAHLKLTSVTVSDSGGLFSRVGMGYMFN
jgi:hypothetical protein